jgi:hypothetical protein
MVHLVAVRHAVCIVAMSLAIWCAGTIVVDALFDGRLPW